MGASTSDPDNLTYDYILPPKTGCWLSSRRAKRFALPIWLGSRSSTWRCSTATIPATSCRRPLPRTRYKPKPGEKFVPRDKLLPGDTLLSTICTPLMTITADSAERVGVHDAHHRMCNRELYAYYGHPGRRGCHEVIADLMAPFGLLPEDIPDTMDLFMNYHHDCGKVTGSSSPG